MLGMSSTRIRLVLGFAALVLAAGAVLATAGCASGPPKPTMADLLNRAVGTKTRADFIQQLGPPQQTMRSDGDEFFVYSETVNNPLADLGAGLSSGAAGYRGQTYTPPPRPQRLLILRFDGKSGLLKGWNYR